MHETVFKSFVCACVSSGEVLVLAPRIGLCYDAFDFLGTSSDLLTAKVTPDIRGSEKVTLWSAKNYCVI